MHESQLLRHSVMLESRVLIVRVTDCARAQAQAQALFDCDPRIQGLLATCDLHGVLRHLTDIFGSTLLDSSCVCNISYTENKCYTEAQGHEVHESLQLQFASKRCAHEASSYSSSNCFLTLIRSRQHSCESRQAFSTWALHHHDSERSTPHSCESRQAWCESRQAFADEKMNTYYFTR